MADQEQLAHAGGRRFSLGAVDPEEARAIFERIARLALRMADAASAHIALGSQRRMWIAGDGKDQPGEDSRAIALAQLAVQTPDVLWIDDMGEQHWSDAYPRAPGEADHRFYAAAPIILPDGRRIGALAILDDLPRPTMRTWPSGWSTMRPSSPMSGNAAWWYRRWPGRNSG